jgi:hypothetical protein
LTIFGGDAKKREPLHTVCGNINQHNHYIKQYKYKYKTLAIELPYDPAIPLPGIYPKEMKSVDLSDICAPMFIIALFTIAKIWDQLIIGFFNVLYTHTYSQYNTI